MLPSSLLLVTIALALLNAAGCFFPRYYRHVGKPAVTLLAWGGWGIAMALAHAHGVFESLSSVDAGEAANAVLVPQITLFSWRDGVEICFFIDRFGALFALFVSGLWAITALYSHGYVRACALPCQPSFSLWMQGSILTSIGIAFAGNGFTLFLCYECLTLITTLLVIHTRSKKAMAGGSYYCKRLLGMSLLLFLPALIFLYTKGVGQHPFTSAPLPLTLSPFAANLLVLALLYGVAKAAAAPLHQWLIEAMVAPTPVSAVLHAVAVVKSGIFCLMRFYYFILGEEIMRLASPALLICAAMTILSGSSFALREHHLKRLLAYSTISQLGYCIAILGMADRHTLPLLLLYMGVHGIAKITLFFAAGAISLHQPDLDIRKMQGMARIAPWTMGCMTIAIFSLIGVPPLCGFFGKFAVVTLALQQHQFAMVAVTILSTLLSAAYFLPILYRAYFLPPSPSSAPLQSTKAPFSMRLAMGLSGGMVLLGPVVLPLLF